jgi:hypothetical protein
MGPNPRERAGGAAGVVLRALTARHPRTRYLVGNDARKLAFPARWAPDRVFDRIRVRLFGLPGVAGAAPTDAPRRVPMREGAPR